MTNQRHSPVMTSDVVEYMEDYHSRVMTSTAAAAAAGDDDHHAAADDDEAVNCPASQSTRQ